MGGRVIGDDAAVHRSVPWTFEDHNDACFIVTDANALAVA
jgi:hypothetical protein